MSTSPQDLERHRARRRIAADLIVSVSPEERARLAGLPHPNQWQASDGETALDWLDELDGDSPPRELEQRIQEAREMLAEIAA